MQVYSTFTPQESLFFQLALFCSLRGTLFWINTRSHIVIAHCRIPLVTPKTELYKNNLWDPSLTYIIWITLTENKWLPKRYSRYWSVRGLLHVYRRALQRYTSNSNKFVYFIFRILIHQRRVCIGVATRYVWIYDDVFQFLLQYACIIPMSCRGCFQFIHLIYIREI